MFFKFSFFKVDGKSMSISIPENSFVVSRPVRKFEENALFIFTHKFYGKLIKKLVKVDSETNFWFKGDSQESVSMEKIGPINKNKIIGRVILCISEKGIKIFLWFIFVLFKAKKNY